MPYILKNNLWHSGGRTYKKRAKTQFLHVLMCIYLCFFLFSSLQSEEMWQRVYLTSFPRSGNHWMRFLIEEATQIATSSVYLDPMDWPHLPTLFPWQGYCTDHGYQGMCRYPAPGEIVVVKTHYPHLEPQSGDRLPFVKAVHIVRHPVDCLYSLYVHSQNGKPESPVMPKNTLSGFIYTMRLFEKYWQAQDNVLTIRYEDLYHDRRSVLREALAFIGYRVEEADIERACVKYPPQGKLLKHLIHYSPQDLKYIEVELKDYMEKYHYTIPK